MLRGRRSSCGGKATQKPTMSDWSCTSWQGAEGSKPCSDWPPLRGRCPHTRPAPARYLASDWTWLTGTKAHVRTHFSHVLKRSAKKCRRRRLRHSPRRRPRPGGSTPPAQSIRPGSTTQRGPYKPYGGGCRERRATEVCRCDSHRCSVKLRRRS